MQIIEHSDDLAKNYDMLESEISKGKIVEEEEDIDMMDSADEETKKQCHRKGFKNQNNGPPRKAIKKLIYRELET